jgi:hypothetical protein
MTAAHGRSPAVAVQGKTAAAARPARTPRPLGHALEWGTLFMVVTLICAALLPKVHVPGWVFPLCMTGLGLILGALSVANLWSWALGAYFSLYGLGLSLWWIAAVLAGMWRFAVIVPLVLATAAFSPRGAELYGRAEDRMAQPAEPEHPESDPQAALCAEFDRLWAAVDCPGVKTLEVNEKGRAGREIHVEIQRPDPDRGVPNHHTTIKTLEQATGLLETHLQLKPGCIRFETGEHAGDIMVYLSENDTLSETVPFRDKSVPKARSVNKPLAVGKTEAGDIATVMLRELHTLIVGVTGSGKSNLMNVIVAQLARCPDTLIWMIDMKGGRTARPWLQPWALGKTARPVIDWVATTRAEAQLMVETAFALIQHRSSEGEGGDKITPGRRTPQIMLIFDEMSILMGQTQGRGIKVLESEASNSQFAAWGLNMAQQGRSEALGLMFATQRGTVSLVGGGDLKSQMSLRIALGSATAADAASVLPNDPALAKRAVRLLDIKGTGLIARGKQSLPPTKFYKLGHPEDGDGNPRCGKVCLDECDLHQEAIDVTRYREAELEADAAAALGEAYARRWDRARENKAIPAPGGAWSAARASGTAVLDAEDDAEDIFRDWEPSDESTMHLARLEMRAYVGSEPVRGVTPGQILRHLKDEGFDPPPARQTVQRWLKEDAEHSPALMYAIGDGRWKAGPDPRPKDPPQSAAGD